MSDSLLPTRFLFRFAIPCRYKDPLWTPKGAALGEEHCLAGFAELEGQAGAPDVRAAWSEAGLALALRVAGKRQPLWRPAAGLSSGKMPAATGGEECDGLQVWIDTRDVHNVHRAGRFCHRFIFLPGGPRRSDEPLAQCLPINRAREQPRPIRPGLLQVRSEKRIDGYLMEAFVPAAALTGFDPQEHPRLGFTYAVTDRELGQRTLGVGSPMPYQEDPSLWATLELVK